MTKPHGQGADVTRWDREHAISVGTGVAAVLAWLLALGGLISTISAVPQLGLERTLWLAALCAAPPSAVWMSRRGAAARRIRADVPMPMLERRCHGNLDAITDSERRSLRPIATTAYQVATRTSALLADLVAIPSVRIFHGVRPAGTDLPLTSHAIASGRRLILIESVAWPPGHYGTTTDGRIHCDGTYIGQSIGPLIDSMRHWRQMLPKRHHVSALVVVHGPAEGDMTLPADSPPDWMFVSADDATRVIRQQVGCGRVPVSRFLVSALIKATTG